MTRHASPNDAQMYLYFAKDKGFIGGYERLKDKRRVLWKVETISTRYDQHHGVEWVPIVLTSREVCVFIEGCWAASKHHPTTRAGAYGAPWEANHVTPLWGVK